MTVGGYVWHVRDDGERGRLILVNGTGGESGDWVFICVVPGEEPIKKGDKIWWQGRRAFWTSCPYEGREDVPIERKGYSFSATEDIRRLMNERKAAASRE
jgi:hypothetical protein